MDNLEDVENAKSHHHLLKRPPVDIEFSDLTYSVPQGPNGKNFKRNLNNEILVPYLRTPESYSRS